MSKGGVLQVCLVLIILLMMTARVAADPVEGGGSPPSPPGGGGLGDGPGGGGGPLLSYTPISQNLVNGTQTGGNCGSAWSDLSASDDLRCSYQEVNKAPVNQTGIGILPDGTDVNGWSVVANPTPKCSGDSDPWNELNDPIDTNNGDTSCREGNTNGNRVGVTMQNPTFTDPSDVDDFTVTSSAVVRKTGSQASSFSIDTKVGTSAYNNGATQSTTTSYVRYTRTDNVSPISGVEWTATDINNLVIASRCVDCSPDERVTQMQAKVDAKYNPEYALEVRFSWTGVPVAGNPLALVVECQRLNPGAENVIVQVGQGGNPPSSWRTAYTCSSNSDQSFSTYVMSFGELNAGAPLVRVWDAQAHPPDDTVRGIMALDVLRIDRMGSSTGPTPPTPSAAPAYQGEPPFANLTVTSFTPDRSSVQVGHPLHFSTVVLNAGYRFAWGARITYYDNIVSPSAAIGNATVSLADFQASADFVWTAGSVGNHTVIAFVDPSNAIPESNESDNQRSASVQASSGLPLGKPDLSVAPADINPATDIQANVTATVNVTVHNLGDASASSVLVEVWELERSLKVANYTITSVAPASSDTHGITWTPNGQEARNLQVKVDPTNGISEHNETNNVAAEGFNVRPPGTLSVATPPHILPWCPRALVYGDWYVPSGDTVDIANCYVRVFGNVLVNGTLTLTNVTLELAARTNNEYRVEVRSGGLLSFSASKLTSFRTSYGISALALAGSTFDFVSGSSATWLYGTPDPIAPGGLQVYTNNVQITGSSLIGGQGHGVFVGPGVNAGAFTGDLFQLNRGAGVALAPNSIATVSSANLQYNYYGVFSQNATLTVNSGSYFYKNRYGVWINGSKPSTVNGITMWDQLVAGVRVQDAGSAVSVIEGSYLNVSFSARSYFGLYALRAAPKVSNSTVIGGGTNRAALGAGVVFDTPSPGTHPFVTATPLREVVIGAKFGLECLRASCLIKNIKLASQLQASFTDWDQSSSTFGPGNVITHLGGDLYGIAVNASTTYVHNSTLGATQFVMQVKGGSLRVENNSFTAGSVTFWIGADLSSLTVRDNTVVGVPGYSVTSAVLTSNPVSVTIVNNTFTRVLTGVEVSGRPSSGSPAVVDRNRITGLYYPPGHQFGVEAGSGLVDIYNNATALVRNNTLRNGAWGVSLDDARPGVQTKPFRSTYALIRDNAIDYNGYVAVGIDTSTSADILHNWANRSSGWGLFMESSFTGNRVENNSMSTCHGIAAGEFGGCIRISIEWAVGGVRIANNTIAQGNTSGIYVRDDYNVIIRDNTVSNITGKTINEYGECITVVSSIPVTLIHNTLKDCRIGVWIQRGTGHDLTRNAIANYTVANVTWGLRLDDSGGATIWANVHDNNTFSGWTYGVWTNATFVDPNVGKFKLWWGDVFQNGQGIHVQGNPITKWGAGKYYHAECNWWKSASGPLDSSTGLPDYNPLGQGQFVTDYFHYRDEADNDPYWLQAAAANATQCKL